MDEKPNKTDLPEEPGADSPAPQGTPAAEELTPGMVEGAKTVGVTAGASTPQWIIDGFLEALKGLWTGEQIQVSFYE